MACVDEGGPPPPELSLAWDTERWGVLPDAGGLYDQDYALLRRMKVAANVYAALSGYRNMKGNQIHNMTDAQRRIVAGLRKDGLI